MNMQPVHRYELQMSFMVHDPVNQDAHSGKRNQEGHRGKKHPLPRPIGNSCTNQVAQSSQLQKNQQHDDNQTNKCKQKGRAISGHTFGHTLLNHPPRRSDTEMLFHVGR